MTEMNFWGRRDPQAVQRRRAWCYFMSHYRERLATNTGFGYFWQMLAVIIVMSILAGYLVVSVLDMAVGGIALGILMMLGAFVWLMHSADCAVKLAMEARTFAEKAIKVANSQAEIEQFFDKTYPWLFH